MNSFYHQSEGRWSPEVAWWLNGYALQDLLDFMYKTGCRKYMEQAKHIIEVQKAPLSWWPQGNGSFRADSTDDTAWWALAMVRMFDITKDKQYLDLAVLDEAYMYNYWSVEDCNGGMVQDIRHNIYKNAIANELYMLLATELHNRTGEAAYLKKAKVSWEWFQGSGMINSDHLINDGLAKNDEEVCFNNKGPTWTYNQGVILGALTELWRATKETSYLTSAREIADAVIASNVLTKNDTLTEICESDAVGCNNDQQIFKGIFAKYLAELSNVLKGDPYRPYLVHNAKSAFERARSKQDFYDVSWAGPFKNATLGTQASAVSLLVSLI
ncbi:hypothetical protein OQA88_280 [Cercophora sp. LCS_1]